jgi:hypothetical protein
MSEIAFINSLLGNAAAMWNSVAVTDMASRAVPDSILGDKMQLLRTDIYEQWGSWFLEALADPMRYVATGKGYPHIFYDVNSAVSSYFPKKTLIEKRELAQVIARIVELRVENIRAVRRRVSLTTAERLIMLELSENVPRCWICGVEFSKMAIESFRDGVTGEMLMPRFVDVLKPVGLKSRDLRIEADHILPFSLGGKEEDNLQLACGWCNRQKSALQSIYQVESGPIKAGPNSLGFSTLPRRFWVVRLLALNNTCEHPEGCTASSRTHEMTVSPRNRYGALNPNNLMVTCLTHDPLGPDRLQPINAVTTLWSKARAQRQ